jgi:hypothetical protein
VIAVGLHLVLTMGVVWGAIPPAPRHVIFAFVDHFEPTGDLPDPEVTMWIDDYTTMANRHVDADGRHPTHSFFLVCQPAIPAERIDATLTRLNQLTYQRYGEVELHLHHGLIDERVRTEQEATDEFLSFLEQAKKDYNAHGALVTAEPSPQVTFGFIHGMWALDNSRIEFWPDVHSPHRAYCGVNRELDLLKQNGCYADFTFPAWGTMEPSIENSVFYAADDNSPASYQNPANVRFVEVNQPPLNELMIIEGPADNANIGILPGNYNDWPSIYRMQGWVDQNIHVLGRDDWIFIKVHTHGCAGDLTMPALWDCFFGFSIDSFYWQIEQAYNDAVNWKLHYVSAREMYNIVKAAEAGMTGDPNQYRDFLIPPYANIRILTPNAYRLIRYDSSNAVLEMTSITRTVDLALRQFTLDATVFESNKVDGDWSASDAIIGAGQFGELRLIDETPSRCYWISKP